MSNAYLKLLLSGSHNFNCVDFKICHQVSFWGALTHTHWNLKILVVT